MPADFGPLNAHDTQRVYDQINALSQLGLSDRQIMEYLGQSQALGRSALDDYMNAAGMQIAQSFQPQFDQARSYLGANPLLADSGYANRLNRQLLTDLAARESSAFNTAAADQANRQVGYLQSLRGQQVGLRSGLANQAYNTILHPPQKPSTRQRIMGGIGQVGGAVIGGLLGGPPGAAAGSSLGVAALGGSGGYAPGFQNYQSQFYGSQTSPLFPGGVPQGGYSDPALGSTMMRRSQYPWQR